MKPSSHALSPRGIRTALGLPRIVVAVAAGCSEPTVRSYELDQEGVTQATRAKLAPVYQQLGQQLLALDAVLAAEGST